MEWCVSLIDFLPTGCQHLPVLSFLLSASINSTKTNAPLITEACNASSYSSMPAWGIQYLPSGPSLQHLAVQKPPANLTEPVHTPGPLNRTTLLEPFPNPSPSPPTPAYICTRDAERRLSRTSFGSSSSSLPRGTPTPSSVSPQARYRCCWRHRLPRTAHM